MAAVEGVDRIDQTLGDVWAHPPTLSRYGGRVPLRSAAAALPAVALAGSLAACNEGTVPHPDKARGPDAASIRVLWRDFRSAAARRDYRLICRRTLTTYAAGIYADKYGLAGSCAGNIRRYDLFNGRAHLSGLIDLAVGNSVADANYRRDPVPADFRHGTHYFSVQFERQGGRWRINQLFGDFVNA